MKLKSTALLDSIEADFSILKESPQHISSDEHEVSKEEEQKLVRDKIPKYEGAIKRKSKRPNTVAY